VLVQDHAVLLHHLARLLFEEIFKAFDVAAPEQVLLHPLPRARQHEAEVNQVQRSLDALVSE
jgi:hypothetical protein